MIPGKRSRRTLTTGVMLVAFAWRALIAPGFMPASDRPFSLEICWEDFPVQMLSRGGPAPADSMDMGMDSMSPDSAPAHPTADSVHDSVSRESTGDSMTLGGPLKEAQRHHSGNPAHSEHCVFGTACSAGPVPHLPPLSDMSLVQQRPAVVFVSIAFAVRLVYLPQPRAPPVRLS